MALGTVRPVEVMLVVPLFRSFFLFCSVKVIIMALFFSGRLGVGGGGGRLKQCLYLSHLLICVFNV